MFERLNWTAFGLAFVNCLLSVPHTHAKSPSTIGLVSSKPASERFVETEVGFMVPYIEAIPGTDVKFEMVPVPGGEFLIGSPESEVGRETDEGPQVRLQVTPFWIGKTEVTWAEYQAYMSMYDVFKKLQRLAAMPMDSEERKAAGDAWPLIEKHGWNGDPAEDWGVDAVTSATPLYIPSFHYGAGDKPNQPAVTMTQFAARQYTKWLSGITGREYRLPTEAEWEYAARAGSIQAYCFGENDEELRKHAWYDGNSHERTHPVAKKKPNAWGLYDMHGNVAEWTLDEYSVNAYSTFSDQPVRAEKAVRWPTGVYPRSIRGGSWLDAAKDCRSAARRGSEEDEWKASDPNLPLSPWWFTEEPATGIGMRIVRPLKQMTADSKKQVWEPDVDTIRRDVSNRLKEGRGAIGIASPSLPSAIDAAQKINSEGIE